MKKLTTLLLLIAMLLPLASCGDGGKDSETETKNNVSAESDNVSNDETTETETTRADYPDELPEKDFGGKTFTVLGYDATIDYIRAEELTGDVMGDSHNNRNIKVADRFGIDLQFIEGGDY